jgi:RimJ/RimL family protein N-acetyltransferase
MHPRDLNRAQLELECIGVSDERRLHRIPGAQPDDIGLVLLCRYHNELELFIRDDADRTLVREVTQLSPDELWQRPETLTEMLYGSRAPSNRWWKNRVYYFTEPYDRESFPLVVERDGAFVIEVDDREVSRAESSRRNHRSAELGTETDESYRRRGFATQVCRAWANYQLETERIPFYNHSVTNNASAELAGKLQVTLFMESIVWS